MELEKVDKDGFFAWYSKPTRGHGKKPKMTSCQRYIKRVRFPHRSKGKWNRLDPKTGYAKSISKLSQGGWD